MGTHYLNPPLLMPTVEVIAGEGTSAETLAFVRETVASLGKLPITVRRDVPGFAWNRLQFALVRELTWLVENGVASAEDLDTVMREGLARRWRQVGPLRAIALGGIDTWNRSGRNIVPELSTAAELPDLHGVAITGGNLAADAARRDAALAAELREPDETNGHEWPRSLRRRRRRPPPPLFEGPTPRPNVTCNAAASSDTQWTQDALPSIQWLPGSTTRVSPTSGATTRRVPVVSYFGTRSTKRSTSSFGAR